MNLEERRPNRHARRKVEAIFRRKSRARRKASSPVVEDTTHTAREYRGRSFGFGRDQVRAEIAKLARLVVKLRRKAIAETEIAGRIVT